MACLLLALIWSVVMPGAGAPGPDAAPTSIAGTRPEIPHAAPPGRTPTIRRDEDGPHPGREADPERLIVKGIGEGEEEREESRETAGARGPALAPSASDRDALARRHAESRLIGSPRRDARSIRLRL